MHTISKIHVGAEADNVVGLTPQALGFAQHVVDAYFLWHCQSGPPPLRGR